MPSIFQSLKGNNKLYMKLYKNKSLTNYKSNLLIIILDLNFYPYKYILFFKIIILVLIYFKFKKKIYMMWCVIKIMKTKIKKSKSNKIMFTWLKIYLSNFTSKKHFNIMKTLYVRSYLSYIPIRCCSIFWYIKYLRLSFEKTSKQ